MKFTLVGALAKQEFVIIARFAIAIMQNTCQGKLSETLLHDSTRFQQKTITILRQGNYTMRFHFNGLK